jgi:hypothetical protein
MSEFALWNYLTGERAGLAVWGGADDQLVPGYSEKEAYPAIPYDKLHVHYKYPETVTSFQNAAESPRHNGAFYMTLDLLPTADLVHDTTFWVCDTGAGEFPNCTDSFQTRDTNLVQPPWYSFTSHIDTFFNVYLGLGGGTGGVPTLPWGWGVNIIYQFEEAPDSLIMDRFFAPDAATLKLDLLDHRQYRSLTFVLTPASADRSFYENPYRRIRLVGYRIGETNYETKLVSAAGLVLDPYPNPVLVEQMDRPRVTFRVRFPTNSESYPLCGDPFSEDNAYVQVDVYTIAGERVRTVTRDDPQIERNSFEQRDGEWSVEWDLRNDAGSEVAAGVYLAYAHIYCKQGRGGPATEGRAKVVVIR